MKISHKQGVDLQALAAFAALGAIVSATNAVAEDATSNCPDQIIGFEFDEIMLFESAGAGAKSKSVPAPDIGANNPIAVTHCENNMYEIKIGGSTGWVLDLDVITAKDNTNFNTEISAEPVPFAGPTLGAPRGYGKGSKK